MSIQASLKYKSNNKSIYKNNLRYYNMEKTCVKCKYTKPIENYKLYDNNSYSSTCKKCLNEMDKLRKRQARRYKNENILTKCEKCETNKPLNCFAKPKKYYKQKICLECYPSFLREQKKEWHNNQHNTNVNYRIKKSLAARLRNVLNKEETTMSYVGCNIQFLREWVEYNFTSDMTWDNYGSFWSIDHVIPVSKFDLTIEKEKFLCWNWTNLTPVSVKLNSSKRQQIDMEQVKNIIEKLDKFKEEGSTTKWFSCEYALSIGLAIQKSNSL